MDYKLDVLLTMRSNFTAAEKNSKKIELYGPLKKNFNYDNIVSEFDSGLSFIHRYNWVLVYEIKDGEIYIYANFNGDRYKSIRSNIRNSH